MKKRETRKTVEIQGRKFEIRAFDAYTGSYIAFTLMERILPMGMGNRVTAALQNEGVNSLPTQGRTLMSKAEFIAFQRDCLSAVSEVLPARNAPVLNANGTWGVENIGDNAALVLLLTIHALVFNISGFFEGNTLKDLTDSLRDLSPANTQT